MSGPRVFQSRSVTAVVDGASASLYAGSHELRLYSSFSMSVVAGGRPMVEIWYEPASTDEGRLRMEEEQRIIVAEGWVGKART